MSLSFDYKIFPEAPSIDEKDEYKKWEKQVMEIFLKTTTWRTASNEKGKVYYFDKITKKTQWDLPDIMKEFMKQIPTIVRLQLKDKANLISNAVSHDKELDVRSDEIVDVHDNNINNPENADRIEVDDDNIDRRKESQYDRDDTHDESDDSSHQSQYDNTEDDNMFQYKSTDTQNFNQSYMQIDDDDNIQSDSNNNNTMSTNHDTVDNTEEILYLSNVLCKRDSILEPDVIPKTKRLRFLNNEEPKVTVKRLSDNYVGYPVMTNIVAEWLIYAKYLNQQSNHTDKHSSSNISHTNASTAAVDPVSTDLNTNGQSTSHKDAKAIHQDITSEVEILIMKEISKLIRQKFDKHVDEVILQSSNIPTWLLEMMQDDILRSTLIQLYNSHSDSSLLGFVLKKLSKMGYHREIAHLVHQFEYLEVFNDIMVDVITRVSVVDMYMYQPVVVLR